jgi:hypothetical protein
VSTPFDRAIDAIIKARYHNHRLESHSDTVSEGILRDLLAQCQPLRTDFEAGVVRSWMNIRAPGGRKRKVDLFVGEPGVDGEPDIERVRIAVENKSVITAHRNRTNRIDDLEKVLGTIHSARPEAILVATVLIGLAERVLNIPDQVHKFYRDRDEEFERDVRPRLSSGDQTLWKQFDWGISKNRPLEPARTVQHFRALPTRHPGHTHTEGYDYVFLIPVHIDNVNPPRIVRDNDLEIDVDADYQEMLRQVCSAYTARWHM